MTPPSLRKPVGVLLILAIVTLWAAVTVIVSPWIATLPALVEAIVYLVLGIAWILPLRPLLSWMETGRFSR